MTDAPVEPVTTDDGAELARRVVTALFSVEPNLLLLRFDDEAAELLGTSDAQRIALIQVREDALDQTLTSPIKRIVKGAAQFGGPVHVVALGGGAEVARAMKAAAPTIQPVPMGFHHVTSAGGYARITGKESRLLERAGDAIWTTSSFSDDDIAARVAQGVAYTERERAVAVKLHGHSRVTWAIAVICLVLAGLSYLWGNGEPALSLYRMGAGSGTALRAGEVWRPLASAFLHANVFHLLVNMLALFSFGVMLEGLLGPRRYVLLYGASALGGALASAFVRPERWSVGASGAIWGLMAAGIGVALRPKGLLPQPMVVQMRRRALVPLAMNVFYSFQPGIDMLAHLGGGVVGFALAGTVLTNGLVPVADRAAGAEPDRKKSPIVTLAAGLFVAATALSIAAGIAKGHPWEVTGAPVFERATIGNGSLTIELPKLLLERRVEETRGSAIVTTFGRLEESPMVFEVIVVDLKMPLETLAAELEALLESERKALDEQAPDKAKRLAPASRVQLGTRPAVKVEHELNGVKFTTYLFVVGHQEVVVRGYQSKRMPATWSGATEKAATSVMPK
jgi:rhomboid protease GluP